MVDVSPFVAARGRRPRLVRHLRVADLAALVAQLHRVGIGLEVDPKSHPIGTFANLRDPEGHPVQLWQPAGTDLRGPG